MGDAVMTWSRQNRRVTLRWIFTCLFMFGLMAVMASPRAESSPRTVVYDLDSSDPTAPTLVWYYHLGDQIYDGLNWGNSDGDTMPWRLSVEDQGSLGVWAQSSRSGLPWPQYTCTITVGGVVVVHNTASGGVTCNVGF